MCYVYLLECADGTIYTGMTDNLERRFWQHKNGKGANYTKKHGVKSIIYKELHNSREEAHVRELEIKTWTKTSKISLANGTLIEPQIFRPMPWYFAIKKFKRIFSKPSNKNR